MHLAHLALEEFRAYRRLELDIDHRGLRLVGPNASGKSTLLEAVALLATTRSPRAGSDREAIGWQSGEEYGVPAYMRCQGRVVRRDGEIAIEVSLELDPARQGAARKHVLLSGRPVRAADAVGTLKAVLFSAEDVDLIGGSPATRRRYLDLAISQLDGGYLRALSRFNRVLAERNSLLKSFARDRVRPDAPQVGAQLAFWDEELVAHGSRVVAGRVRAVARLARFARDQHARLAGADSLTLTYRPSTPLVPETDSDESLPAESIQATVARDYETSLLERRRDEVRRGVSLVGPHRDDLGFALAGKDLATFGSRGQQRLAVVALKLAETDLLTADAGESPVLLLDDVLSELDAIHRRYLIEAVGQGERQLIVTATDRVLLDVPELSALPLATVAAGSIEYVSA
jgi:DNA replication and repair protein RecF